MITQIDSSDSGWDHSVNLGTLAVGEFEFPLTGLESGKTYFYRALAENSAGQDWSDVAVFSTGDFDFGSDSIAGGDMLLWLDASDIDADGDPTNEPYGGRIDFWRDKSGANRNAGDGNGQVSRLTDGTGLQRLNLTVPPIPTGK